MGSIVKRNRKGIDYYYYIESERINGKPQIVTQHYLGNAEKIYKRMLTYHEGLQDNILYSNLYEFGASAFCFDIINHLELQSTIRKSYLDETIAPYLTLLSIYALSSRDYGLTVENWFSNTFLKNFSGITMKDFSTYSLIEHVHHSNLDFENLQRNLLLNVSDYVIDTDNFSFIPPAIISRLSDYLNPDHNPALESDEKKVFQLLSLIVSLTSNIAVHKLKEKRISTDLSLLINTLSSISKIETFYGSKKNPERIISYTPGSTLAQKVNRAFKLTETYHLPVTPILE